MKESDKPVIVVTGSSGYLGAAVVKRLHEKYRVVGLDRHSPPHPPHQAECICFAGYLIPRTAQPLSCFFEQTVLEC
ncbi:NAD dependent epimerase/dehydratase family protein [Sulfitobacter delicatus]|jgi:nucleoside-diphosphate-sugar epimerase|uniref:NAD dependent epimerase/dehydratase family protein n=1 Tax=Sulfitobacter delicatus TaxID=218672 RepID=A0A1G7VBC4_9RHOB|nr:NAD dependent epimerase/dehydratase family protein [Sulfitobacter delicatus]|tara:strand:- start:1268 stop:1495 length:228 start_codon:yes stop_codon:yes gene_type:complete